MQIDPEYIRQLSMYEISGRLEEGEREYLQEAIKNSSEARSIYEAVHSQYTLQQVRAELREDFNAHTALSAIKKRKQRRILAGITAGTAAAVLIFIAAAYLLSLNKSQPAPLYTQRTTSGDIELRIGTAQAINLSDQQGEIQAGNTVLTNNNKQLSYSGASTQIATLTVPNGKDYNIQLSDGTTIQLNAATTIRFPLSFSGNKREITLNGEAFLSIHQDPDKPFYVHLPHGTVQVLGTAFNVNTYNNLQDRISLVEGAVKVKVSADSAVLEPGYEAAISAEKQLSTGKFDAYNVLAWRKGIYLFNNASAEEVGNLIKRYYGIEVVVENMAGKKEQFTGSIDRNEPVHDFLHILKVTRFINGYQFDKDGVLHIR